MKRFIAIAVIAALIAPALPAFAADSEHSATTEGIILAKPVTSTQPTVSLRESAKAIASATPQGSTASSFGPRALPRQNDERVRNQGGGGGHAGMIIGLVTAAAGIAGTVYMVKMMKKTSDANKTN
jgi:hypothetical protein